MHITLYSVVMTIIWSSVLIILFSLLRLNRRFIDVCSVSGVIILYMFCCLRMIAPVELSWTRVITSEHLYNSFYKVLTFRVLRLGDREIPLHYLLGLIWVSGTVLFILKYILEYICFIVEIGKIQTLEDHRMKRMLDEIKSQDKTKLNIAVLKSGKVDMPIAFGLIKKKIIVPDKNYREKELYYILKHEYTHFKNHDLWVKMLINLFCAIYWWNPFVYLIRRNLDDIFEMRCDQIVVRGLADDAVADYLQTLMDVFCDSEKQQPILKHEIGLLGSNRVSSNTLKERFDLLLHGAAYSYRTYGITVASIIAFVITIISYSFIFQSRFEAPVDEIENVKGSHAIDQNGDIIVKDATGYYICTDDGTYIEISEDDAVKLTDYGFVIKDIAERTK